MTKRSTVSSPKILFALTLLFSLTAGLQPAPATAASAKEIDIGVDATLERFKKEITGGEAFLKKAVGVLVFPKVLKAGLGIGGEYGEGALRVNGKTVAYYNVAGASIGFQFGVQSKSLVIVFLTKEALDKFRKSKGWKVGVDGSIALIKWGVGEDVNNIEVKQPVVGFVFDNKGLMYNLTLEGAKFTKIDR